MNKKSILYALLDFVFLAVFNVVFFVVGGTERVASVWISYAFIHLAYILLIATSLLLRRCSRTAIFGFSLYSVAAVYFLAEFVVGVLFVLIAPASYKAALVVQVILAGIYAVLLLTNLIANEHTADNVEKQEGEVAYIKETSSRVQLLVGKMTDKQANKALEAVYDLLHASPSASDRTVEVLEANVKAMIADLEQAVAQDNADAVLQTAQTITDTMQERNRRLQTK